MRIAPYRSEMLHASYLSRPLKAKERGYSFIELLVVLVLISLVALAGAPWFFKVAQRNKLKSAAHEFSITLAAARMRAVKRNLPAQVIVTRATSTTPYHIVETFEQTTPTATKVGELQMSSEVDFPLGPFPLPVPYDDQPAGLSITFLPDGRVQGATDTTVFNIRGVRNAGVTNDLPVIVAMNGKVEVLPKPNPAAGFLRGTEWK
jgi:prepilin-type N-terminal cleavage/methylation domain-containing protein